jgi:hypothetical protein
VVAVAGAGFAKLTEDPPLSMLRDTMSVPGIAQDAVLIGALASIVGLVVAGIPIAVAIAIDAVQRRRISQLVLLAVPVVAGTAWIGVTAFLSSIPFDLRDDNGRLIAFLAWVGFGLGAVAVSCVALGLAALNSQIASAFYRRAINPARLTVLGMAGVAIAIVAWGLYMFVADNYDFSSYEGLLATSTWLTWLLVATAAVGATIVALRATTRLNAAKTA